MAANAVTMPFGVYVDWDGDGAFTGGDDITAYVKAIPTINLGVAGDESLAFVGSLEVILDNADRLFSPAYSSSPLYGKLVSNKAVKVTITDGVTTWTLFTGFTRNFTPAPGQYGSRECVLECADLMAKIQDEKINIPLQQSVTADYLIQLILNSALKAPAASGTVTLSAAPANNDTLTPNGTLYTYKSSFSGSANEILVAAGKVTNILATVAAINGGDGSGTLYAANNNKPTGIVADHGILAYYDSQNQDTDVLLQSTTAPVKTKLAQSVYLTSKGSLTVAQLYLKKVGVPTGTLTLRVETDNAYSPSGTLADSNATATVLESSLSTAYGYIAFTFPAEFTLQAGVIYWLVLSTDRAASGVNYIAWGADNSTPSATGNFYYFSGSWTNSLMAAIFILGNPAITITATARGAAGNAYTLAKSSTAIAISGATLTGGQDYPVSPALSAETGQRTLDIAADAWSPDTTNAMSAIKDVTDSERGLFWIARNGQPVFKNLYYQFRQVAATATLAVSSEEADLSGGLRHEDIYNQVEVTFTPRATLASGIVAKATSVVSVPGNSGFDRWNSFKTSPNKANMIRLSFTDPATGKPMGAKSITTPISTSDYTVTDSPTPGAGFNYTGLGYLIFSLSINGSNVEVSMSNVASGTLYVHLLQVRGVGIVSNNPSTATATDISSQSTYGKRVKSVSLPLPSGQIFAQALADYTLSKYKTPAYRINAITFGNINKIGGINLFSLEIGDTLTLTDYQTGATTQKYLITGIQYAGIAPRITGAITFYLTRLDDTTYGIFDNTTYGLFDTTMRAAI
jgi:hypothetical protein